LEKKQFSRELHDAANLKLRLSGKPMLDYIEREHGSKHVDAQKIKLIKEKVAAKIKAEKDLKVK
jgi:hypothetical protein